MLRMPGKGRKTIDLPEQLVNTYQLKYKEKQKDLELEGITTFQGYISKILNHLLEEEPLPDNLEKLLRC